MLSIAGDGCPACTEDGKLLCTGCKNVKYCSLECQHADWAIHSALCKDLKKFEHRPSEDMCRVVYFPPESRKPEFMWRKVEQLEEYQTFDESGVPPMKFSRPTRVVGNEMLNKNLDYLLDMTADDCFLETYPRPNTAVVSATNNRSVHPWSGPIFASCGHGYGSFDTIKMGDMDMRAYSDFVAYLTDTANQTPQHIMRKGPKIQGVKLLREGDRIPNVKPYASVMVPASHPLFDSNDDISGISKLIGMPLYTAKYSTKTKMAGAGGNGNQAITFMHLDCNPTSQRWGCAPMMEWQDGVGSVFMVREDRLPLSVVEAEAFADFCQTHLQPLFEHSIGGYCPDVEPMAKHAVLAEITPAKWAAYLARWKEEKAG